MTHIAVTEGAGAQPADKSALRPFRVNVPDAALAELRWLVEELRVSTFAQELRTAEPVSPKRLAKLVEGLRAAS